MLNRVFVIVALIALISCRSTTEPASPNPNLPAVYQVVADQLERVAWDTVSTQSPFSFSYKMKVSDNTLYLIVSVIDQKLIFQNGTDTLTDHIDIWLSDARITKQNYRNIEQLEAFIDKRKQLLKSDPASTDIYETAIKKAQNIITSYRQQPNYTRLSFIGDSTLIYPHQAKPQALKYIYVPNKTGYDFTLILPLQNILSVYRPQLDQLEFMIDVYDIDSIASSSSLLSSSNARKYGDPTTFSTFRLNEKVVLDIDPQARLYPKMNANGHYQIVNGQYQYFVSDPYVYSGMYGADRAIVPGKYLPIEPKPLSTSKQVKIAQYDNYLLLSKAKTQKLIPLKKQLHSSGGYEYEVLYHNDLTFLLLVSGASRWPMGYTHCGVGLEKDVIYMRLSEQLTIVEQKNTLVESCLEDIYIKEAQSQYKNVKSPINIQFNNHKGDQQLSFDPRKARMGYKVKTINTAPKEGY